MLVEIGPECESLCVRLSADPPPGASRPEMRRIAVLLVVAGLALAVCGCGAGNKPKREVLRSANLISADLYVRVSGPSGLVDYIVGRLRASAFDTDGRGVFLCSASTPPGGGVHGMCGYHAARAALRYLSSPENTLAS